MFFIHILYTIDIGASIGKEAEYMDGYFKHMNTIHAFQETHYPDFVIPRLSLAKDDMETLNQWYEVLELLLQNKNSADG